ncbi:hypothetical protein B0H19DRAFT_1238748, partial [Mycena capillaripes]
YPETPELWKTTLCVGGRACEWIESNKTTSSPFYDRRGAGQNSLLSSGLSAPLCWYKGSLENTNLEDDRSLRGRVSSREGGGASEFGAKRRTSERRRPRRVGTREVYGEAGTHNARARRFVCKRLIRWQCSLYTTAIVCRCLWHQTTQCRQGIAESSWGLYAIQCRFIFSKCLCYCNASTTLVQLSDQKRSVTPQLRDVHSNPVKGAKKWYINAIINEGRSSKWLS